MVFRAGFFPFECRVSCVLDVCGSGFRVFVSGFGVVWLFVLLVEVEVLSMELIYLC
jgi:hypothetical protein